jgi:sporulation protein YlmC with PRC-barrel domain
MLIDLKKLMHLPTCTESGVRLGLIQDIEFDLENHSVRSYTVGAKFFSKEIYRIRPAQIKEINAEKIVVEDAVLKEKQKDKLRDESKANNPALGGAMPIADKEIK